MFYSLVQIIVASLANLCSIKVAVISDLRRLNSLDIRSANTGRADSFGVVVSRSSKQQKIAAVAAVTTSGQVSQANVDRLIMGLRRSLATVELRLKFKQVQT